MSYLRIALASLALSTAALPAEAGSRTYDARAQINIRAFVPVLCRVALENTVGHPDDEGMVQLGTVDEFCNAPRGYRVTISHPENLEGAAVIRDGVRIPLSASGYTVLTDSDQPDIKRLSLSVDLGDEPERFHRVGFRIEAKG